MTWKRTCYEQAIVAETAINEAVDNSAPHHPNGWRVAEWIAQPVHLMALACGILPPVVLRNGCYGNQRGYQ